MTHRLLLALAAGLALACSSTHAQAAPKVLRSAFPIARTGFDRARIGDLHSRTVAANTFETPLTFDYLARPAKIQPQTAAALPEASNGDACAQAIAAKAKGRRLPLIDRAEISIAEKSQPRWLAFLNGEHDVLDRLPNEFASVAIPNGKLAPRLAKRGVGIARVPLIDSTFACFGMEHPLVGGYTADKVALRRTLALADDVQQEITLVRRGQAIPAQSIIAPRLTGHTPL
jgi:hypothetical protein